MAAPLNPGTDKIKYSCAVASFSRPASKILAALARPRKPEAGEILSAAQHQNDDGKLIENIGHKTLKEWRQHIHLHCQRGHAYCQC